MLTKEVFQEKVKNGLRFLDGATGSNLQKAGMPMGCCTEEWCVNHPEAVVKLQRQYAEAGSQVLYAPTFQAQPLALAKVGLEKQTEALNAMLVSLSRKAAPGCLIGGDLTTLAACLDSYDPEQFDTMVANYRRQIRGLLDGGADFLAAETLLYPQDAEAIWAAAQLEGAGAVTFTFTMQSTGKLFAGMEAADVLERLEKAGAAAVGLNCVPAGPELPPLISRLRRRLKGPLICKPNAGIPVIAGDGSACYPMEPQEFARIQHDCFALGANLLGGCCGTGPEFIRAMTQRLE